MISTNLPSGTKIICIDVSKNDYGDIPNLILGQIYTLKDYIIVNNGDIAVRIAEQDPEYKIVNYYQIYAAYERKRFDVYKPNKIFEEILERINNMTQDELNELEEQLDLEYNNEIKQKECV